jgi:hypothetical protein
MKTLIALALLAGSFMAHAEYGRYGFVSLDGNSRDNGALKPPGFADVMVCDVNGPDGFLAVRTAPWIADNILRKIERLAIMRVDSQQRSGKWIYAREVFRTVDKFGFGVGGTKDLGASGWVHTDHLCDFHYLMN